MAEQNEKLEYHVYEVFAMESQLSPPVWQYSLLASSPDMALAMAQENFLRRGAGPRYAGAENVWSVWVVRRDHIYKTSPEDAEMFQHIDKTYREDRGYDYLKEKWRGYKQERLGVHNMA